DGTRFCKASDSANGGDARQVSRKCDEVPAQQIGRDPALRLASHALANAAAFGVNHLGIGVDDAGIRMLRQALQLTLKLVRKPNVVGIEKRDEVACAEIQV